MGFPEFARRRPILSYYLLTFGISWGLAGLAYLALILWLGGLSDSSGGILFPLILLGPLVSGLLHVRIVDGQAGWKVLGSRLRRLRTGWAWWLTAGFTIPLVLLGVLQTLDHALSPVFAPHYWVVGFTLGIPPGILEEFGWSGFAFPKLAAKYDPRRAALIMGPIWGLWHAPVVDFLGAAYPHGSYWVPFFLAFVLLLSAARVLILWVYANTDSIPTAQVMHISLTGSLVFLGPASVSALQEAGWYALAGVVLWIIAILVMVRYGANLRRVPRPAGQSASTADSELSTAS
jgi:membrane protease YdiL (CAAX protease family)